MIFFTQWQEVATASVESGLTVWLSKGNLCSNIFLAKQNTSKCVKKLSRNYLIILLKVCEWQNAGTDRTDFLNRLEWSRVCLWKRWTSNWWGWGGSWSCQGGVFCWRGSCGFKKGAKETERVTEKKKISERQTIAARPTGTWWRFSQRSGPSSSSYRSSPLVSRLSLRRYRLH